MAALVVAASVAFSANRRPNGRTTVVPAPVITVDNRISGFRPVSVTWISDRDGWVLGAMACEATSCTSLLRTRDGGASWVPVPAPPSGLDRARRVRFADERNGWVYSPDLWATHDGGATWRHLDVPGGDVSRVEAAAGRAYAVARVAAAQVFGSAVDADDWRPLASDPVEPYSGVALRGAGGYLAGADGAVRALSGTGLDRRGTPCARGSGSLAVAGNDVFALCAGGLAAGSSPKTLMTSSDGARTWSEVGSPPRAGTLTEVAAASPSTVVVAASSGASFLYRSEDGGRTWTTVYTDTTQGGAGFVDLGFTSSSRGAAVLGQGALLVTSDGGRTWSPVTFGT